MAGDYDAVNIDRNELENNRKRSLDAARQNREQSRDSDIVNLSSQSEKRDSSRFTKSRLQSPVKTLQNSTSQAQKYGFKQLDTFLFAFCTITTISVVGILLALLSIIVLDIRWLVGKFSRRIPPMMLPQSIYLAALNFTVAVVLSMMFISIVTVYCLTVAGLKEAAKSVVYEDAWLTGCFE